MLFYIRVNWRSPGMIFFRISNVVKKWLNHKQFVSKGILLFSSVLLSNPSPELSFVDAEMQYCGFEKKDTKKIAFDHNKSLF